jgi:proteasome accessory factor C
MSHDEDKLIRQLSLLSFLLSRPRPFTAREIQESVEGYAEMSDDAFTRRFYADRADLAKVGVEIRVLATNETAVADEAQLYFLPEGDFRLPGVEFTAAEKRALCLALAALDGRFAYARPLRLALMTILRGRHDPALFEVQNLPVALAPDEDAIRAGRRLSRLEDAVTRGKTVSFTYPSADGGVLERTLDPYSLFLIQGHWYVVGRDHLRDAVRSFRLGRIKGPVRFVTEKSRDFSVPDSYDPEAYGARPPWLIGPLRGEAEIEVSEDLAWWVGRLEPHVRSLGDHDGCTRFALPYSDERVLLSWVVGLGGCAELLAPMDVRGRLRESLLATSRAHEGTPARHGTSQSGLERPRTRRAQESRRAEDEAGPIAPEHLARAMTLLYYLLDECRPELITWEALAADLGLTRAEVEDDLSLINLINFGGGTYALMAEAGAEGVTVVRDVVADAFSEPARLSPVMARALLLALDLLGDAFALEGLESLASVREKVHALIGTDVSEGSVIVDELLPPDPQVLETINHAIRDHQVVTLEYYTASRQVLGERLVEPYLLFHSPDGWYLEGYCLKARAQRTFKLERIRSARATGVTFSPRTEVDLTRRRTGLAFLPGDVAGWATVRFHPRWRTYLEEQGLDCADEAERGVVARMPYLDERWMVQEIVRYLGEAELLSPASARQAIRDAAAGLAARYESPGPAADGAAPQEVAQ